MASWVAVGVALAAAGCFSTSSALKHRSAGSGRGGEEHGIAAPGQMVRRMLQHPAWLAGVLADVGGVAGQVVALHLGGLLLVQPVLVSAVAGTLVVSAWLDRRRPSRRELLWSAALFASLAAVVLPLQADGVIRTATEDRAPGYVLGAVGAVLVVGAVGFARRRGSGRLAASSLGAATGLLYAASAALITVIGVQLTRDGVGGVLRRDEVYVLVAVAVASQVLNQASFAAARISASVPVTTAVDLVASVVLGAAVFDQPLPHGVLTRGVALLGLLGAVTTTFVLASTPAEGPQRRGAHRPG